MKKMYYLMLLLCLLVTKTAQAGVLIGSSDSPQSFSVLELESGSQKGLRIPQMTDSQRDAMTSSDTFQKGKSTKAKGLLIFNTTTKSLEYWNGSTWVLF